MTISGAYGRDYTSKAAIEADLLAGKDFQARGLASGYVTMPELLAGGYTSVTVRYKRDRSVTVINLRALNKKALKAKQAAPVQ
jgi:hypothetical protein